MSVVGRTYTLPTYLVGNWFQALNNSGEIVLLEDEPTTQLPQREILAVEFCHMAYISKGSLCHLDCYSVKQTGPITC